MLGFLRMTSEGSSFYSAEWLQDSKKRKPEGEDKNAQPPKTLKPKPAATTQPKPSKGKIIVESDDDSKSD